MIVYWVALLETLVYLCAIPLHVAVFFHTENGIKVSAGFSLFEKRFAQKRAYRRLTKDNSKHPKDAHAFPYHARLLIRILLRLRYGRIYVHGSFSTGDAAHTALIMGSINAIEYALRPFIPHMYLNISPNFNASISYARFDGMISLRSGQIILAAISGAMKNTGRRIAKWINIPSKAS